MDTWCELRSETCAYRRILAARRRRRRRRCRRRCFPHLQRWFRRRPPRRPSCRCLRRRLPFAAACARCHLQRRACHLSHWARQCPWPTGCVSLAIFHYALFSSIFVKICQYQYHFRCQYSCTKLSIQAFMLTADPSPSDARAVADTAAAVFSCAFEAASWWNSCLTAAAQTGTYRCRRCL